MENEGGFVAPDAKLPEEEVAPAVKRTPKQIILDLMTELGQCSEELARYREEYGPLDRK